MTLGVSTSRTLNWCKLEGFNGFVCQFLELQKVYSGKSTNSLMCCSVLRIIKHQRVASRCHSVPSSPRLYEVGETIVNLAYNNSLDISVK